MPDYSSALREPNRSRTWVEGPSQVSLRNTGAFARIRLRILSALCDRRGVSAAEYAILAVGVVVAVGTAVTALGDSLLTAFANVGAEITNQQSSLNGGSR